MLTFKDALGTRVELTFDLREEMVPARHVLLLIQYQQKWLVTKHRTRGIEFPGGKAEKGETIEAAVKRETYEETGVVIDQLIQFAQYTVHSEQPFGKAVFTAKVIEINVDAPLYETEGALWLTTDQLDACEALSFHMKDAGMAALRKWVETNEIEWND